MPAQTLPPLRPSQQQNKRRGPYLRIDDNRRFRLIKRYYNKALSMAELARQEEFPPSTIKSIIAKFETKGEIAARSKGVLRVPNKMQRPRIRHLITFFEKDPTATLSDARNSLLTAFPTLESVDISTVHRKLAEKRRRLDWCVKNSAKISWQTAIFLDESGFNLDTIQRVGRARRGEGVMATRPPKARNLSLLIAASQERGVFAQEVQWGHHNSALFVRFIQEGSLPEMRGQKAQIIMDNARIHHNEEVVKSIEDAGHELIFQPPYTPQFNLSKNCFALIESWVSKQQLPRNGQLKDLIIQQCTTVTPGRLEGFICKITRWIKEAQHMRPMGRQERAPLPHEREFEDTPFCAWFRAFCKAFALSISDCAIWLKQFYFRQNLVLLALLLLMVAEHWEAPIFTISTRALGTPHTSCKSSKLAAF